MNLLNSTIKKNNHPNHGNYLFFCKNLMIRIFVIGFILLLNLSFCKKNKLMEFNDDAWKEQSQKMSSTICLKMEECSKPLIEKLEEKERKLVQSQLSSASCIEKHKKTNVYKLRGENPELIKSQFTACFEFVSKATCEELISGAMEKVESCTKIKEIQNRN